MTALWEPEARFRIWFEIEAHATDALAGLGVVPKSAAKALWDWWGTNPEIDVAAVDAIEAVTRHDVIAFLTWVAEQVGDEARFMHQGMTSSDVLDTCLAVQLKRAADLLIADLDELLAVLKRRAIEHKLTPTIGRSHGIHAEPVTFGLKLAQAFAEFSRNRTRLVRSAVVPALENVALWHERDISHSSVERGIAPDATIHLDFALRRLAMVMERLVIYPENMEKNLDRLGGLVHSQRVMLALTQKNVSREDAYAAVQGNAMRVWRGEGRFLEFLKADPVVSKALTDAELEDLFDNGYHFKHVDTVFRRVFGEGA